MGERKQLQEYELKILHLRGSGGFASIAKIAGMDGSDAALVQSLRRAGGL